MSAPSLPLRDSSPAGAPGRRRSQFAYRNLYQLASYTPSCPLRVIAHIDLDAFYAQCEMVRLKVPEDQPLAVQQWQGLIAINYPARKFGIGRHCTVQDAKKLCPDLICQHVATWREGDEKWAYHADAASNIATHKVSLDPYRLQSRKILALIKELLPSNMQKVEKASIDEVFLDLSAHIHSILLQRFPELTVPPPYDDPTEKLPLPSVTAPLDWQADALAVLEDTEAEADDPDWDDVAILIGSEIVRGIRAAIREKLKYTCSAGIASNKLLSKLGSGHNKPNQQTVVRNRAIHHFLSTFKFTKIRNLGGKLGDQVVRVFGTEAIGDLLAIPVEQFKSKLGEDTGVWLHDTIRGIDTSEVNSRIAIQSMLSAKSFRPSINNRDQAVKWLRIFVGDIFSRLVEEGVLENKRRPRTINLHYRHAGQTRSRQSPIPHGKTLNEETLFDLANNLLSQIVLDGRDVWPCANLSLSVGGFEEGITGNKGIAGFLLKGEAALTNQMSSRSISAAQMPDHTEKRRRTSTEGIKRFFSKQQMPVVGDSASAANSTDDGNRAVEDHAPMAALAGAVVPESSIKASPSQLRIHGFLCPRCRKTLGSADELQSHQDWHFAKDLQDKERGRTAFARPSTSCKATPHLGTEQTVVASKRAAKRKKMEAGQSKLRFG